MGSDRNVLATTAAKCGVHSLIAGLCAAVLAIAASVGSATATAGDDEVAAGKAPNDEAVPTSAELFDALRTRYRELDAYRDTVRTVRITQQPGEDPHRVVRWSMTLAWSRPNRLVVENHHEVGTLTGLYCDGESLVEANMALEQYRQTDAPATLEAIAERVDPAEEPAQRAAVHPVLAILWGSSGFPQPDALTIHRAVDVDNGRRLIGELYADDDRLDRMRDDFDGDVLIPFTLVLDEDGLLRRTELDMTHVTRMLNDQLGEQSPIQDRQVMIIDRQALDAPLADDAFASDPPHDFRRIDRTESTDR